MSRTCSKTEQNSYLWYDDHVRQRKGAKRSREHTSTLSFPVDSLSLPSDKWRALRDNGSIHQLSSSLSTLSLSLSSDMTSSLPKPIHHALSLQVYSLRRGSYLSVQFNLLVHREIAHFFRVLSVLKRRTFGKACEHWMQLRSVLIGIWKDGRNGGRGLVYRGK